MNGMIKMQSQPKIDKMEVKDTKPPILKPILRLKHCTSINGLKNGCANKTMPKCTLQGIDRSWGALKAAKGPKCGQHGGQKHKIVNFEAHLEHCNSINGLKKWLCKQKNKNPPCMG